MKKFITKTVNYYKKASLAAKIRYSYIVILVPFVVFTIYTLLNMWSMNRRYSEMIDSTVTASAFSLEFKKDFDYATYLVIVGNKTYEESGIEESLDYAERVVTDLEKVTSGEDNLARLDSVKKYLGNLRTYSARIHENFNKDNHYEENMQIWENDVQIVTTLVEDTVFEYIYYDIRDIEMERDEYNARFSTLLFSTVFAVIVMSIVILFFSMYIPKSISRPINQIVDVTNKVSSGDLSVRSEIFEGEDTEVLSKSLNAMIDKINELLTQVTTEQIRLRKAEFELLQSQINPHFLYNTLDAIVWLAESGEKEMVVKTVGSLSDFFRASLNQGKDITTVREDIDHVRSYLEIQHVRYQDILEYEIDVPEEIFEYMIPKITIQPLVENALYHGIKNKRGKGKITVTGRKFPHYIEIYVTDNGQGITEDRLKEVLKNINNRSESEMTTYGLYNVNERIRLDFGDKYGISISSEYGQGTTVSIRLPLTIYS